MLDAQVPIRLSDQGVIETIQRSHGDRMTLTHSDIIEDASGPERYPSRYIRDEILAAQIDAYLRPLRRLRPGWDSYGALPVSSQVLDVARDILVQLVSQRVRFPSLVPTVRGGLSLEWTSPGFEFSLTLSRSRNGPIEFTAYYFDEPAAEEWEADARDPRVSAALDRVRTDSI